MGRNKRSVRIEIHEDLAAQLSAARSAQERQLLKLRVLSDLRVLRLARLIRTPDAMTELEELVDVLLDLWDEVAVQAGALAALHDYIKAERRRD